MSCPSDLWDCIQYVPIVGGYFDIGKSAADAAVGSTWYAICQSFGDAATSMLQAFAKSFASIPDVDLASGGIKTVYGISLGIAAIVAALLLLGQVIRTMITHDGSAMATALTGIGKTARACLLTLAVATAALAASDALTYTIIKATFHGDAELSTRLGAILTATTAVSGGAVTAALLLIFGLVGILLVIVLWFEMLLRNAAIAILVATSPIAAAGQMSDTTRGWWTKLGSATTQLIILKPVIALVFAIGLSLTGNSKDIETLLSGMLVLVLAVFAWPAVARFFAFASVTVAGGAGLAALVGFAAGRATVPGVPAGVEPSEFSRRAEQRTMSDMAADADAAPPMARPSAPAAPVAAGATALAPGAAGLAVVGAQMAQRGINILTGRMEQMAGHAGMPGANPYAQPAGTPRNYVGPRYPQRSATREDAAAESPAEPTPPPEGEEP